MPLRVAAVVVAYLLYRRLDEPLAAGICIGIGFLLLSWAVIERFTTWRHDRLDMMVMGQGLLGVGVLGAGLYLLLR